MSQPESETVQHELINSKNTLTSGRIRGGGGGGGVDAIHP